MTETAGDALPCQSLRVGSSREEMGNTKASGIVEEAVYIDVDVYVNA